MNPRAVRVFAVVGVVAVGLIALCLILIGRPFGHKLVVKAYFTNAMGLHAGAQVRMAGVEIGSVQTIRARPEIKVHPAEVVMVLTPSYELNIPNDSTAMILAEGVLGQSYVEIDASRASGTPIATNGVLHTAPTTELSTPKMLQKVADVISKSCDCASANGTTRVNKTPKKLP